MEESGKYGKWMSEIMVDHPRILQESPKISPISVYCMTTFVIFVYRDIIVRYEEDQGWYILIVWGYIRRL